MENRFEDVNEEAQEILRLIRAEYFPHLSNVNIKMLFDMKKRKSGDRLVLGRIQRTNDLIRHLTSIPACVEGFDYIMYLDHAAFTNINRPDKIRIVRHEMRHIHLDIDSTNPYKLVPHDIEDFVEEIENNRDEPRWRERVAEVAQSIYGSRDD